MIRSKAEENLGTFMIYEICESLREQLIEMNELILGKLREFDEKNSMAAGLSSVLVSSADTALTFTPVTKETFEKWCIGYMEKITKIKEERRTERDLKETGR